MKEDSGRVVRRSSGNSGEPAIQVICLVGLSVLVVFVDVAKGMHGMSQIVQVDKQMRHLAIKANTNRALEVDQAKTMLQASSFDQQQQTGPRTPS